MADPNSSSMTECTDVAAPGVLTFDGTTTLYSTLFIQCVVPRAACNDSSSSVDDV